MDFIRTLAAVAVVWGHCFNHVFGGNVAQAGIVWHAFAITAGMGRDAVLIFFVVSGFWITRSIDRSIAADRWSWQTYLINRLSRLWIVLIPALAIGGAIDMFGRYGFAPGFYAALHLNGQAPADVLTRLDPVTLLGNIAFLQQILVPVWGSNGPLWSLACEFWYYVWFPALLLAIVHRRFSKLALIATVATMTLSPFVLALFPCWLLGSALHYLTRKEPPMLTGTRRIAALAGGTAIYVIGEAIGHVIANYYLGSYAIALGFATFLYAVLRSNLGIPEVLSPLARYGGSSSYSLYAVHAPILLGALALLMGESRMKPSPEGMVLAVALTLALVGFAYVFSLATEYQTDKLRATFEKWLRSATAGRSPTK